MQSKLEAGEPLTDEEQGVIDAARQRIFANFEARGVLQAGRERIEADPFGELFASINTYFDLAEQGQISLADARARITEAAELHKRLAEIKGIPAKPL